MYVDTIRIENFRTYRHAEIDLLHPDRTAADLKAQFGIDVLYPNINLILGNNGMGKSAFLKAIGLACLGPTVRDSGIFPYRFVRREPGSAEISDTIKRKLKVPGKPISMPSTRSLIKGVFLVHEQDGVANKDRILVSTIRIDRKGDLETMQFLSRGGQAWDAIYQDDRDAFFFVGYGASRRSEERANVDNAARRKSGSARAQRLRGLFEDEATLIPLSSWLPAFTAKNPGRAQQAVQLLRTITGPGHYEFTGELEKGEYLFQKDSQLVPFPALSDGYKAFFSWAGDLLFHVCHTAPTGKKLVENRGIVMVDEIDLHLHPSWQMEILPKLSRGLPNIQFIVTSHSPLIAGSLQWANLIALEPGEAQSSLLTRKSVAVHGLDADQILTSPFFALNSTRTGDRAQRLRELRDRARRGDADAAMAVMAELTHGSEASNLDQPIAAAKEGTSLAAPNAQTQRAVRVTPIKAAQRRATQAPRRKK
jgi:hypothetical protein